MPAFKTHPQFPGLDKLPVPVQGLVGAIWPQDSMQVPALGMTGMPPKGPSEVAKALGGIQEVPHDRATLERLMEVFRPKDLSKVLPAEMNVSQVSPDFGYRGIIKNALGDYQKAIQGLLGQK